MPALRVELRPARALAAGTMLVHAAGAAAILLVMPGAPGIGVAVLLLALGAAAAWERALLRGTHSPRVVELEPDGTLRVLLGAGQRATGRAAARCHVGPWWILIPLGAPRRMALLTRDMLGAEDFRRLRIWALWGRVPTPGRTARAG